MVRLSLNIIYSWLCRYNTWAQKLRYSNNDNHDCQCYRKYRISSNKHRGIYFIPLLLGVRPLFEGGHYLRATAIKIWLSLGEGGLSNSLNNHCRLTSLPFYQQWITLCGVYSRAAGNSLPTCAKGGVYLRAATSQERCLLEEIQYTHVHWQTWISLIKCTSLPGLRWTWTD